MRALLLLSRLAILLALLAARLPGQAAEYVLGPDDQIKVWVLGVEELSDKTVRVDTSGHIDLPLLGRIPAGGLTVQQLKANLVERLAAELRDPRVSIDVVEFGSQPVSVIGAVATPGVHQLRGRKTLVEVLSLAGGPRPEAGYRVKITRAIQWGVIPLSGAKPDATGKFSTAEVKLKELLEAKSPAENILVRPHDVISVPAAEMIYVIGAVRRAGGFPLHDRETVSALQALSFAEGLAGPSAPQNSRILRQGPKPAERVEIAVNLKRVLEGKVADVALRPNDILFVPSSASQKVAARVLEAVIQTGTGIVIWRH